MATGRTSTCFSLSLNFGCTVHLRVARGAATRTSGIIRSMARTISCFSGFCRGKDKRRHWKCAKAIMAPRGSTASKSAVVSKRSHKQGITIISRQAISNKSVVVSERSHCLNISVINRQAISTKPTSIGIGELRLWMSGRRSSPSMDAKLNAAVTTWMGAVRRWKHQTHMLLDTRLLCELTQRSRKTRTSSLPTAQEQQQEPEPGFFENLTCSFARSPGPPNHVHA